MPQVTVRGVLYEYQNPYADCPNSEEGHAQAMRTALNELRDPMNEIMEIAQIAHCIGCEHIAIVNYHPLSSSFRPISKIESRSS